MSCRHHATRFRELHAVGQLLVLPNAWDAAGIAQATHGLTRKATTQLLA